jgi:hypothetical protein
MPDFGIWHPVSDTPMTNPPRQSSCLRRWRTIGVFSFLTIFLLCCPQRASANAGTPLMWASMLHLVFGNALIGVIEGALMAKFFRLPGTKCLLVMIAANYASAWLGGLFIQGAVVSALPLNLNNAWGWFWIMVVATYLLTLLIEWPFVAWCFRGQTAKLKRSLQAACVVQTITYVLLFGWYWSASGVSLYTRIEVVAPADLSLPESVLVYYIEPASGDVHARHLSGGDDQKVFPLSSRDLDDRLFAQPCPVETGRCEIVARQEGTNRNSPRLVTVVSNLAAEVDSSGEYAPSPDAKPEGTWFSFGDAPRLSNATTSSWDFSTGFWPIEGLRASNKASGQRVRLAYETPFGQWAVRNAVHLPTDKVLFQLGSDQICAFDPATRRVALLWRGRGPVAVIPRAAVPGHTNVPATPP